MKKKGEKFLERKKETLRIKHLMEDCDKAIRNQALIPLDKPIPDGWVANWVLRGDTKNRSDAWVFEKILKLVNVEVWSKRKDFMYRTGKSKKLTRKYPGMRNITESEYLNLPPQAKKYFVVDYNNSRSSYVWGVSGLKSYYCTLTYEFEVSIKRDFITHYKEHDEVLVQEYSEYWDKLYNDLQYKKGVKLYKNYGLHKWYRTCSHRRVRKSVKSAKTYVTNVDITEYDYIDYIELDDKYTDSCKTLKNDWW